MAEISTYIKNIESASRGEEVRVSIINALKAINDQGTANTIKLGGHDSSYFATASDLNAIIPMDSSPTKNSSKAVTSGGVYTSLEAIASVLDTINGESV